jgi:hypothetical protein
VGIDSKLRGCNLVALKVLDIEHSEQIAPRAIIQQKKTGRPVQFEVTPVTRQAVQEWIRQPGLGSDDYLIPSRLHGSLHIGTRQYARILRGWVRGAGLSNNARTTDARPHRLPRRSKGFLLACLQARCLGRI